MPTGRLAPLHDALPSSELMTFLCAIVEAHVLAVLDLGHERICHRALAARLVGDNVHETRTAASSACTIAFWRLVHRGGSERESEI